MESYSTSYSSSNKSSYKSQNNKIAYGSMKHDQYSWLHSVRKSPAKTSKKAPMVPTPVKAYKVDPLNFKQLVQSLTCAPQFLPQQPDNHHLLQSTDHNTSTTANIEIVPSPPRKNLSNRDVIEVSPPLVPVDTRNNWYQFFQAEYLEKNSDEREKLMMKPDLLKMKLFSPTSFGNRCFVPPIMNANI